MALLINRRSKGRFFNVLLNTILYLATLASLFFGGLYVWQRWQIYQDQQFAINVDESNPADRQRAEGKDETEPDKDALKNYQVAADHPRALYIDKINVAARILPMGVNNDKSIQAPINIFDSGWYNGSAKPGQDGVVFIDAHASGQTRQGLFAYLDTLKKDDEIRIELGDRQTIRYRVLAVETIPLSDINMTKILSPRDGVKKGMNLMTCTGDWVKDDETYNKRVVVYTEQIE